MTIGIYFSGTYNYYQKKFWNIFFAKFWRVSDSFLYTIGPYLNKMYYSLLKSAWKSWNVTKNKKFI